MEIVWVGLAAVAGVLVWLGIRAIRVERALRRIAADPASLALLQGEIQAVRDGVDRRLGEHLEQARDLSQRLGRLQSATEQVERLGREITELQKLLRPPQLRGPFGEQLLENLLADILPRERFRTQHTYPKSGVRVDAAILLDDHRVLPIDAKFPLDNFRRYVELREGGHPEADAARRDLDRDVRGHVDTIAARYLSPDDGAVDVALMYIPSESVYHEIALRGLDGETEPVAAYALSKRVVPVSPNSMHAYLCVILMGLKGFQLQESAREILGHLTHLRADVSVLRTQLDTALRQAQHSQNNLRDVDGALRRVEVRLDAVQRMSTSDEHDAAP
ncbi:MAG: DNA recombination protein RmuC [Gemmatimonadota bacterium]